MHPRRWRGGNGEGFAPAREPVGTYGDGRPASLAETETEISPGYEVR